MTSNEWGIENVWNIHIHVELLAEYWRNIIMQSKNLCEVIISWK